MLRNVLAALAGVASRRLPAHGKRRAFARRTGRRRRAAHAERGGGGDRRARESARRRRIWRRLRGCRSGAGGGAHRVAPRRGVRRPLAPLQDHDPEFAGRQRLRASRRLPLRDARADRADRRIVGARGGDLARDRARAAQPRARAREGGGADGDRRARRDRRSDRPDRKPLGARQLADDARHLLAQPGDRGRPGRDHHRRARRLRSLRRLALPRQAAGLRGIPLRHRPS